MLWHHSHMSILVAFTLALRAPRHGYHRQTQRQGENLLLIRESCAIYSENVQKQHLIGKKALGHLSPTFKMMRSMCLPSGLSPFYSATIHYFFSKKNMLPIRGMGGRVGSKGDQATFIEGFIFDLNILF